MQFTLDIGSQKLVLAPGSSSPISSITSKRSPAGVIAIQLARNGMLVEEAMTAGFALKFTAKSLNQFDENPKATLSDFSWDADAMQYAGELSWVTDELDELFGVHDAPVDIASGEADDDTITTATDHGLAVGDRITFPSLTGGAGITVGEHYFVKTAPSATTLTVAATADGATIDITTDITDGTLRRDPEDVESIQLGVEVGYKYAAEEMWKSSENQVTLTLLNNYIRDDDGAPTDPGDAASEDWLRDRAVRYDEAQALGQAARIQVMENTQLVCDALTGGAAGALDGIVTASGAVTTGRVVMAVISSVLGWWQLQAGTSAEDVSGGIVRPDDYDGTTNARIWVRVL